MKTTARNMQTNEKRDIPNVRQKERKGREMRGTLTAVFGGTCLFLSFQIGGLYDVAQVDPLIQAIRIVAASVLSLGWAILAVAFRPSVKESDS